jgi:hypothetical protein
MLNDLRFRLRALFRRNTVETELDDELRFHFEHEVEKYKQSGMIQKEATRQARLSFGGQEQVKEDCRDAQGTSFIADTLQGTSATPSGSSQTIQCSRRSLS